MKWILAPGGSSVGRRAAAAEASNASAKWDSRSFVQGQSQIMTASFENYVDKYSEPNGKMN